MFYALKFGEKPPNDTIRPMQPRGTDNRSHVIKDVKPNATTVLMNSTSDWAPAPSLVNFKKYKDPMGAQEVGAQQPPPIEEKAQGTQAVSTIWLARQRKKEIAAKPNQGEVLAGRPATPAKPATTREAPFAVGGDYSKGVEAGQKASQSYGAFSQQAPPQPTAIIQQQNEIFDVVEKHKLVKNDSSQAVVGNFSLGDGPATVAPPPAAGRPLPQGNSPVPMNDEEAIAEAIRGMKSVSEAGDAPRVAGNKAAPPFSMMPRQLPMSAIMSLGVPTKQLVSGGNSGGPPKALPRYHVPVATDERVIATHLQQQQKARESIPEKPNQHLAAPPPAVAPAPLTASTLDKLTNWRYQHQPHQLGANGGVVDATTGRATPRSNASSAQPADVPGPQIQQWLRTLSKREDALPQAPSSNVDPLDHATAPLRKCAPPPQKSPPPSLTGPQINKEAFTLATKPQTTTKAVAAHIPTVTGLPLPVGLKVRDIVVSDVGGPPPTSIARKTLETIKSEREAQLKARWLLEAPARAEALQRRVDAIFNSLRKSIEAKGYSEPTKGAQYVIKVCRQHTSTPNEEMTFDGLCDVLEKGFNVVLSPEEVDALFERMDVEESTVVAFRVFGEMTFGIYSPPKDAKHVDVGVLPAAVRKVLEDMKSKIAQRHGGEAWLSAFVSAFRGLCKLGGTTGNDADATALDANELHASLTRLGLVVTYRDAASVINALDINKSGTVDLDEFLYAMRGKMPRKRRELVFKAFRILDADQSGSVTLKEIAMRYRADQHPRVLSGEATVEDVLREFVKLWDRDGDAEVSWFDFLDYYKTLSASIENEEYFELMMRNCWHMSGGKGSAENTTCRRLLVTFHDQSQRVVEIENDLGIGPKDKDKMMLQLERQGVTNIARIDLYYG